MERDIRNEAIRLQESLNNELKIIQDGFVRALEHEISESEQDKYSVVTIFEDHTKPLVMSYGNETPWQALEEKHRSDGNGWQTFQDVYLNSNCTSARATLKAMNNFRKLGPKSVIYYKEAQLFMSIFVDELLDLTLSQVNNALHKVMPEFPQEHIVRLPSEPGLLSLDTAEAGGSKAKVMHVQSKKLMNSAPCDMIDYLAESFESSYRRNCTLRFYAEGHEIKYRM